MGLLEGKSVVITGAGRGIGAAYAKLAAEHGASVVVNAIDGDTANETTQAIVAAGGRAVAHVADVSQWDQAGELIERALVEFGRLDGLVNNAALFIMARPHEQDPEEFRRLIEVNVIGTAFCGIHALKHFVAQDSGSLVNISSGASWGSPAQGAYGASKGAVSSLTYSWARDVEGTGVRINAVAPNAMTRMAEIFEAFYGDSAPGQNVGKDPMLNAPAVVFLLSDRSVGINGQVVRIDGEEMTLMTHPAVQEPALYSPNWTPESVAEAFDETLTARQLPLGISRV